MIVCIGLSGVLSIFCFKLPFAFKYKIFCDYIKKTSNGAVSCDKDTIDDTRFIS